MTDSVTLQGVLVALVTPFTPDVDFSFDFQDLLLRPVGGQR